MLRVSPRSRAATSPSQAYSYSPWEGLGQWMSTRSTWSVRSRRRDSSTHCSADRCCRPGTLVTICTASRSSPEAATACPTSASLR